MYSSEFGVMTNSLCSFASHDGDGRLTRGWDGAGVGTVVAGTLKAGTILPNSSLLLGPDVGNGKFNQVGIKSIHYKRLPVNKVCPSPIAQLSTVWPPSLPM